MKSAWLLSCVLFFSVVATSPAVSGVTHSRATPRAHPSTMAAKPASSRPTVAEMKFVRRVSRDLQRRFHHTASAAAAGYFRFTDEDKTGAISWVNPRYWRSDPRHPSQLWYDDKGNLIGVDYSVPKAVSSRPPQLWGISPTRWVAFLAHVHYAVKNGSSTTYGIFAPRSRARIGGPIGHYTRADIVKRGLATRPSAVRFVFTFPDIWDLDFWVIPNPKGPFAEYNYAFKPSRAAKSE